jgi:ribosomal 30S subunit maturation factor RimM
MDLKYIGVISSVKGLDGSFIISDLPRGLKEVKLGVSVYIGFSEKFAKKYTLRKWKYLNSHAMIAADEIKSPEAAEKFKEQGVFVEKSALKQKAKFASEDELVGFKVFDYDTKKIIGIVSDVWLMPTQEVIIVSGKNCEYSIPAVDEFIMIFDPERRRILAKIIDGFKNLNYSEDIEE